MRKHATTCRSFAALLSICILLSIFSGLITVSYAEDDPPSETPSGGFGPTTDEQGNEYTIYLKVDTDGDGEPDTYYGPGDDLPEISDGTVVEVSIDWHLNDGTREFEFNLGDLSALENFTLDVNYTYQDDGGHTYEVWFTQDPDTGEITVHARYPDDCDCTSRNIKVNVKGPLHLDPRDENPDGDNSFQIGDQDIPYTPDYSASHLDVLKEHGALTYDADSGKFYLTYTVTNTVNGRIEDPVFYDDLPDGMTLVGEPEVTFTPGDPDFEGYPGTYPGDGDSWELHDPYGEHSFGITFPDGTVLYDGDTVTYTYTVEVSEEIVKNLIKYGKDYSVDNTAWADWEGGEPAGYVDSLSTFRSPSIEKNGVLDEEAGTIEWTITYNLNDILKLLGDALGLTPDENGEYGDVLGELDSTLGREAAEAFLESLGLDVTITDTLLGNNHALEDGGREITFSIFDMLYAGNGKYTRTVTTTITDDSVPKWENAAQLNERNTATGSVEPGYGVQKRAGEVDPETGTISWTVYVDVPGKDMALEYLQITDIPVNSGDYPSGEANVWDPEFQWKQRVLMETIQINGVPLKSLVDEGKAEIVGGIPNSNGGFVIRLLESYERDWEGFRKVAVTFRTQVYTEDPDLDPDAGLEPFYHYENKVSAEWQYADGTTKTDTSFDKVEETADFDYVKNYVAPSGNNKNTETDKFVFPWEIRITNPLFYDKTGAGNGLFDLERLEMAFLDTLPEGHVLVEDSIRVELTANSSRDLASSESIRADIFAYLNSLLRIEVTAGDDGTFSLICTPKDDMDTFREKFSTASFGRGNTAITVEEFLKNCGDLYFTIRYETKIKDVDTFYELWEKYKDESGDSASIPFVNTVQGTINDVTGLEKRAETSRTYQESLQKKYVYEQDRANGDFTYSKQPVDAFLDNPGGYRNIYFEIAVNPDRMDYLEDPNALLTLIDNMGADLNIIPYSIQITEIIAPYEEGYDPNHPTRILDPSEFTFAVDAERNRITFNVPDGKYLILSYWAIVVDDGDNIFEAENSIEIYGYEEKSRSESEAPSGPITPSSSATSDAVSFSVYKYYIDETGAEKALDGVEFLLEQLTYHPENDEDHKFTLDSSSDPSHWIGTLRTYRDQNGVETVIPNVFDFSNLPKGAIFRLTETKTKDGYIKLEEPIYFIFANYDDNKVYTNNTVSSEELLALEDYDIQVISYFEQLRIENREKIVTASFRGTKELLGRDWDGKIDEGAYSFKLTAKNGAPMPKEANGSSEYTVTNKMHNVDFPSIVYTEAGKYYYTIEELDPDSDKVPNVARDSTVYEVEVVVEDDGNGGVYVKEINYLQNGEKSDSFAFINDYHEPERGRLRIVKKLEGNAAGMRTKSYIFTVKGPADVAGMRFEVEGGIQKTITFDENAVATVTVVGAGTVTILGLLPGDYIVEEVIDSAAIPGYDHTVTYDPADGKVTVPEDETVTVTATNTYIPNTGDLTVSKTVKGNMGNRDQEFTFTVTLSDRTITGVYGDMEFVNGVASFKLKHGESMTAEGLPDGVGYEVTETDNEGYTVTSEGAAGAIEAGKTAEAAFTNTRNLSVPVGITAEHSWLLPLFLLIGIGTAFLVVKQFKSARRAGAVDQRFPSE